ncbi:hypothetical protein GM3708_1108 [Geminocystis sp. NIES-3708]|nr:hypothetical protein GM3708_1108 [Geminocystis sp. NIES-3708]
MIFSGIVNAAILAMIALAVNHISGREHRRVIVVTGGAILGFVIGCAYQGIAQQKRDSDDDFPEENLKQ